MYIVVEVNRVENGSQRSDQPEDVNFEPIITMNCSAVQCRPPLGASLPVAAKCRVKLL